MVYPFLNIMNRHVNKPLKSASTTNRDNRIELGNEKQCELFGEHMRGFQTSGLKKNAISRDGSQVTVLVITIQE